MHSLLISGCGENAEAVGIDALHATAVGDIPGETNVFADVPSRIYSDELNGIMRAESEYVSKDDEDSEGDDLPGTTIHCIPAPQPLCPPETHWLLPDILHAWLTLVRKNVHTRSCEQRAQL